MRIYAPKSDALTGKWNLPAAARCIGGSSFRIAVVGYVVALDAERVLDDLWQRGRFSEFPEPGTYPGAILLRSSRAA